MHLYDLKKSVIINYDTGKNTAIHNYFKSDLWYNYYTLCYVHGCTCYFPQTGVTLELNERINDIRGTVLVVLADTLAAHQLGGFKVGVGFSLRKCRRCMATSEDMQTKVFS